ncbi:uncharacterized protein G2W53_044281 [Senna tora]|uniref:Uncharacterized protein n=1 Tax=Senna tora TaxID=362788 RepID=A0A834SMM0_9FABA|nr:uncharacterized protein G2W53_044281 [Senna tora]
MLPLHSKQHYSDWKQASNWADMNSHCTAFGLQPKMLSLRVPVCCFDESNVSPAACFFRWGATMGPDQA